MRTGQVMGTVEEFFMPGKFFVILYITCKLYTDCELMEFYIGAPSCVKNGKMA